MAPVEPIRRDGTPLLAIRPRLFVMLSSQSEFRVAADQFGSVRGQLIPGAGHLQELIALLPLHLPGEGAALFGVLAVFRGFLHPAALIPTNQVPAALDGGER